MKKVIAVLAIIVIGLCAYDATMIILNHSQRTNSNEVRLESTLTPPPSEATADVTLEDDLTADDTVTEDTVTDDIAVDDATADDTAADDAAPADAAAEDASANL